MYITLKIILGIAVVICSTQIGILLSKKYVYRLMITLFPNKNIKASKRFGTDI